MNRLHISIGIVATELASLAGRECLPMLLVRQYQVIEDAYAYRWFTSGKSFLFYVFVKDHGESLNDFSKRLSPTVAEWRHGGGDKTEYPRAGALAGAYVEFAEVHRPQENT